MKLKILLLLILTGFIMAFYSENYGLITPSVRTKIEKDSDNGFVSLLINASSPNKLEFLTVEVYINGQKIKTTEYKLNGNKKVSIVYYHFIKDLKVKTITYLIKVRDNQGTKETIKEVYL